MLIDFKIKQNKLIQVCVSLVDAVEGAVKNASFLVWL